MTRFRIFGAAMLACTALAIAPSVAQQPQGGAVSRSPAPSAGAPVSTPNVGGGAVTRGSAGANVSGGTSAPPMSAQGPTVNAPVGATSGSTRFSANSWNGRQFNQGTWSGNWDRHRFHRGPRFAFGFGFGPGYPFYDDYAYYDGYPYDTYAYDPGDEYVAVGGGSDAAAYCARRYRSYDPASGTFLGYDGMRHPCP